MATDRARANRSLGNKLNNVNGRLQGVEKDSSDPTISDGFITSDHLGVESVDELAIAPAAVTADKIARGAVGTDQLGVVNQIVTDNDLTISTGPDGYIVLDGDSYPLPSTGGSSLLGYDDAGNVIPVASSGGSLPSGGTAGQILTKISSTPGDATWMDNYAEWTEVVKHTVRADENITKGQAVYVSSSNGTNMYVSRASNLTEQKSSKTLGLAQSNITTTGSTSTGFIVTEGLLGGLNTSGSSAGDPVWLGEDGALIYGLTNKPIAPKHLVFIGIVTKVGSGSAGEIFVKPQNGFELNELHSVKIGTSYSSVPADNDLLAYDYADSLWKNQTAAQAGLIASGSTAGGDLTGTYPNPTLGALSPSPAGTYGSSTAIPAVTVDAKGRVTGVTTSAHADATTSVKGIASFASGDFDVTSGAVTVKSAGIDVTQGGTGASGAYGARTNLAATTTGAVHTGTVAPTTNINVGDHWLDPNTGNLFVYYTDATGGQWIQAASGLSGGTDIRGRVGSLETRTTAVEGVNTTQNGFLVPTGCIMQWATNTPPSGWLLCDGQSTSGYAALASIVGANVPDLRGRVPVGRNSGTFATLGATGGAETHTLTIAEMPSHTHTQATKNAGTATSTEVGKGDSSVGTAATGNGINATGGGGAHNNLQPYIVLNYIIKT